MTGSDETQRRTGRPPWLMATTAIAVASLAAVAFVIYLGLAARETAWPVYVLAVASAPLALLAAAQGVQALVKLLRPRRSDEA
ncbi:MAG: hypothetical protein WD875_04755 [Pirellulales bacterium]